MWILEDREIRHLLETEVIDDQEKDELLLIEQKLNEYFQSQPPENFREQLKQFLIQEAKRQQSKKGWRSYFKYLASAALAAAAVLLIYVYGNTAVWKDIKLIGGLKDEAADTLQIVQSEEVNNSESTARNKGLNEPLNEPLKEPSSRDKNMITSIDAVENVPSGYPLPPVTEDRYSAPPGTGAPLFTIQDISGTEKKPDWNYFRHHMVSEKPILPVNDIEFATSALPETKIVKVLMGQGKTMSTEEVWKLAQGFGFIKNKTQFTSEPDYKFVQGHERLLISRQVPARIDYSQETGKDVSPGAQENILLDGKTAITRAYQELKETGCFKIINQDEARVIENEDNYKVIFPRLIDGLKLIGMDVEASLDRRSGQLIKVTGTIYNFITIGEYTPLTVEQAANRVFKEDALGAEDSIEAAYEQEEKLMDFPDEQNEKIDKAMVQEVVMQYLPTGSEECYLIPVYRFKGRYTNDQPFEVSVSVIP